MNNAIEILKNYEKIVSSVMEEYEEETKASNCLRKKMFLADSMLGMLLDFLTPCEEDGEAPENIYDVRLGVEFAQRIFRYIEFDRTEIAPLSECDDFYKEMLADVPKIVDSLRKE